jgi:hypothetical protein
MTMLFGINKKGGWFFVAGLLITTIIYWAGLHGGFLFDDYPNIVDNPGVQPKDASFSSLVSAALSSPSSELKRPLASLSFAANYLASGLNPYWMKLTNLVIHLLNGILVFFLTLAILQSADEERRNGYIFSAPCSEPSRATMVAALVATSWMVLPINVTGVLYVVQRMESMANVFVLVGLIGYVKGRRRMLTPTSTTLAKKKHSTQWFRSIFSQGFALCVASVTIPAAIGVSAKETAVLLPLYALLIEWCLFQFRHCNEIGRAANNGPNKTLTRDNRVGGLFLLVLALPLVLGSLWLVPNLLRPGSWATRDFSLGTRLLSEARIVVDYIGWTLLPTPDALSFYHDDFRISTGLFAPITTLTSIATLVCIIFLAWWFKSRQPLVALGIGFYLGCHLLTGTVLPLELVYEHRNYFASFGLMLAVVPILAASSVKKHDGTIKTKGSELAFPMLRYGLLCGLMICWTILTALTSDAWGDPLRLAQDLALRAPNSPRAQYELGRTYIIYSHYDPTSDFTRLAYAPLERAAALPESSILPEQALIFMNSRMHLPLKDAWWDSLISKLRLRKPGVQDESSLGALTQCDRDQQCKLSNQRMSQAYEAALSHHNPSARLLAMYGDYAWNVLARRDLGEKMTAEAVSAAPTEAAYRITLVRMLAAEGKQAEAIVELKALKSLNFGGHLNSTISELERRAQQ